MRHLRVTRCDGDAVDGCVKGEHCCAHDLWSSLGRQMMYFLGSITLEDVVEKRNLALAASIKQAKDRYVRPERVRTYLDHNATSPLAARREGGHARGYGCGRQCLVGSCAKAALRASFWTTAREAIARELGVIAPMIVFTSGGTEANNLAHQGCAR